MPTLTARSALLASFCCLAAQPLFPLYGGGVRAAVIARDLSIEGRHHPLTTTENSSGNPNYSQSLFSFPWSQKKGDSDKTQRRSHKQRSHRSIVVPNSHGNKYAINHRRQATTPQWASNPTFLNGNASTSAEPEGIPGTVGIISHVNNSEEGHMLASLYIVNTNGTYVFDASESNRSVVNLINAPGASSSAPVATSTNDTIPVKLTTLIDGRPYCASYDPDPPAPEPLTMEPCNDVSSRMSHKSQTFLYSGETGVIRPTWFQAEDEGTANAQDGVSSSVIPGYPSSTTPGIASPSAGPNLASWSRRDDTAYPANSTYEQNVTLVFIPQRATANNAAINASVSTSTYTQTVTVYSSGSPSSLDAAAATPSTTNSSVPAANATGLNVEVVGNGSSSPSSFPDESTYVSSSVPAAAASGSLSAADIAASLAASYSASSAFASSSAFAVASASTSSDFASASPSVTQSFVAAILERDAAGELTPVSTDPYFWRFRSGKD